MLTVVGQRYPNTQIPYDANIRTDIAQNLPQRLVKRALDERINKWHGQGGQPGRGSHFTVNCAAASLVDDSGEETIGAALSDGDENHSEIQVLSQLIKSKGGEQKKGERAHDFILNNLDKIKDCKITLFTERSPCVISEKDRRRSVLTCDDLLAEIKKRGIDISVYYAIPPASPENEGATLGMLLPMAIHTLMPGSQHEVPLIEKCAKAAIDFDERSVPKTIKFRNQPTRYAEEFLKTSSPQFLTELGPISLGISRDQKGTLDSQGNKQWVWEISRPKDLSHSDIQDDIGSSSSGTSLSKQLQAQQQQFQQFLQQYSDLSNQTHQLMFPQVKQIFSAPPVSEVISKGMTHDEAEKLLNKLISLDGGGVDINLVKIIRKQGELGSFQVKVICPDESKIDNIKEIIETHQSIKSLKKK